MYPQSASFLFVRRTPNEWYAAEDSSGRLCSTTQATLTLPQVMTKGPAKLSLREFYEHHGKPVEASLPKQSGNGASADQARDGDQSYHARLAEFSLDTKKPHRGQHVDDAGYGQGGSRVDVDYDYYGAPRKSSFGPPQPGYGPSHAPLADGTGYAGRAAAVGAAPLVGRTGHAQPVDFADASNNPAGLSRPGFFAGPYSRPAATAAGEDVWFPPPPPPPARRASPTAQLQQSTTAPSAAGTVQPAAAAGVPMVKCAAVPPPPPARKQVQDVKHMQLPTAAGAQPADARLAAEAAITVEPIKKEEPAGIEKKAGFSTPAASATPFATAAPPAAAGLKNEFAEKLAARAIANASKAKSSLLAGSSLTRSGSLTSTPPATSGIAATDDESSGTFVAPAHPFGRPRLNLKPRSVPLSDNVATPSGNTSSSSASSDSGVDAAGEKDSTGSVASSAAGRPRLQLQPRTLPLPQDVSSDASGRPRLNLLPRSSSGVERVGSTASEDGKYKPSVFGTAKPREEVLKGRGVDPVNLDLPRNNSTTSGTTRLSEAAVAKLGGSYNSNGRYGSSYSSVSGADEEWQVAGHGRRGSSKLGQDTSTSAALLLGGDPFFGSSSRSYNVPAPRAFDRDIMRDGRGYNTRGSRSFGDEGYGSFGSPTRGGWGGTGARAADASEGVVFTRALPTRQVSLAL